MIKDINEPNDEFLKYRNILQFPDELEIAYRQDYAYRVIDTQRYFIVFGILLYGLFGILDYFTMPETYLAAWLLRALFAPFTILLLWATYKPKHHMKMPWLINLWTLMMNISILGMIVIANENELAYKYYPIGFMLVLICGYIASGHFGFATIQGWAAILGYFLVSIFDQHMLATKPNFLEFFTISFFLAGMNVIGMILGYTLERINRLAFLQRLVIKRQHDESNRLLLNVLPASVAERLKRGETVVDHFDQAGILFADIEGFTPYSSNLNPVEVVRILNQIFFEFDHLTEKYGLEKIKTIGDAYMVVSGLPVPRADHLDALVNTALDMQMIMKKFHKNGLFDFKLRIGINTGPVVAGIIGFKKFSYDLWGDTVNVASRMESFGISGEIQVTRDVYLLLKERFVFQKRGYIKVKGKGDMFVYLLKGRKEIAKNQMPGSESVIVERELV